MVFSRLFFFAHRNDHGVHSIDALDDGNELAVVDYEDGRPREYMDFQVEIDEKKRSLVADRLIEERVLGTELLLVGVSALLVASKYEEPRPRKVHISCLLTRVLLLPFPLMVIRETCMLTVSCVQNMDYRDVSYHVYTKEQILAKEKAIVKALEWDLFVPTQYVFLVRFVKAAMSDKELENMAFFLAELGLMHYSMTAYRPSLAAASAVYAARYTLKRSPLWTQTLRHHTGYSMQREMRPSIDELSLVSSKEYTAGGLQEILEHQTWSRLIVVSLGATAGQIRKAAVRGGAARKRGVDLNEGDRLVGGPDPLANPMPSRRFSARLLAKARLAVLVERPEVAADYIVKEKKDSRESGSLRSDSPDDKGNSMIDSRKKNGTPALASALTVQNKKCGRPCKYMDFQVDINEEKRSIVADRLIEVHHSFGLMPETLYLTFHIIDQYLSKEKVSGTELPLVGINALLIASKYEESRPQKNIDYGDILRHAYTKEQMLAKERDIKWKLSVPTQYVFLVCFLKAAAMCDKEFSSAQAAIVNSQTLEEVARLEKALKLGQIPEEFMNLGKETTTASGDAAVDGMDTDDQNEVTEAQDQEQNEEAQPIEQTGSSCEPHAIEEILCSASGEGTTRQVAADYIVKEKKDGRESGSLRNDSPDDKGNSMIDSRKKTGTPALASALTVQNKDDGVHSIDALEVLAVVDYVDNIYDFYRHAEKCGRPCKYMDFQVDINEEKRSIVADRLIEVHHSFGLMPETLYLTFHIIDQYLSKAKVSGTELPLVGINALLIASKYEESRPQKLEHMVFFLAELGLMHYSMITYWPSVAAASAVYAARSTLKRTPLWTQTLMHHTGYLEHQLRKCAQQLVIFHSSAAESRLQAVYKKYSSTRFGAVALLPPATELLRSKEVTSS
ncbi:Cyclin, C-terminal domain [Musa troglodytarum]|uniref:Cyclin, C-terminal domain n=1 Tax=Musa troglodytarum TaxID=320322 RepID=A0A9E7KK95_9LILI|nr:Cyclin, C-terminal domain [Musa troglodytarum]